MEKADTLAERAINKYLSLSMISQRQKTERHPDEKTRQTDRQIDKKQTDRQTNKSDRHTDR